MWAVMRNCESNFIDLTLVSMLQRSIVMHYAAVRCTYIYCAGAAIEILLPINL